MSAADDEFAAFIRASVIKGMEQAVDRRRSQQERWMRQMNDRIERSIAEAWRAGRLGGFRG